MSRSRKQTRRYATLGALFGLAFPIIATLFLLYEQRQPFTVNALFTTQANNALLWIIDTAPLFLGLFASFAGARQDALIGVLGAREAVIAERTHELTVANRATRELLDNMQQAIVTVDASGRVNDPYSAHTVELFGSEQIADRKITELLRLGSANQLDASARLSNWLALVVGSDELQWMMIQDQPPRTINYSSTDGTVRCFELDYSPIFVDGLVEKVMVVVKDVTQIKTLERNVQQMQLELLVAAEALKVERGVLEEFVLDAEQLLLAANTEPGERIPQLMRSVHTIKGNAGTVGLAALQTLCHQIEHELRGMAHLVDRDRARGVDVLSPLKQQLSALRRLSTIPATGAMALGEAPATIDAAPDRAAINALEAATLRWLDLAESQQALQSDRALAELLEPIGMLCQTSLAQAVPGLQRMFAEQVAAANKTAQLQISGETLQLSLHNRRLIRDAVVHALRNAIVHGIESAEQRVAAGKPRAGTVALAVASGRQAIVVRVKDDGAGIDLARLKAQAIEHNVVSAEQLARLDDQGIVDLVFTPGLSTAHALSEVSGRGVGMDAIRAIAQSAGGSVQLRNFPGAGCELVLSLPQRLIAQRLRELQHGQPT
ncbi:MAG: Hpt domain-containing protein [Deltaproteobacteria bacterium]|nr:Hpt domain-containing protein [Deltaproteobacteria bacterium]